MTIIPHKCCSKCGIDKPLTEFGPRKHGRDGLQAHCRLCGNGYRKTYYYKNQEAEQKKAREYWDRYSEKRRENWQRFAATHQEYNRARYVQYYQENRDRELAQYREWAARNKDHLKQRAKKYYARNKQRMADQFRGWSKRNPDQVRLRARRRRARQMGAAGRHTFAEWRDLCTKYGNCCLACGGREPDISLTVDHIIPLSKGGADSIDNIQPLCHSCNSSKKDRIIDYRG